MEPPILLPRCPGLDHSADKIRLPLYKKGKELND